MLLCSVIMNIKMYFCYFMQQKYSKLQSFPLVVCIKSKKQKWTEYKTTPTSSNYLILHPDVFTTEQNIKLLCVFEGRFIISLEPNTEVRGHANGCWDKINAPRSCHCPVISLNRRITPKLTPRTHRGAV